MDMETLTAGDIPGFDPPIECIFCKSYESCMTLPAPENGAVLPVICKLLKCIGVESILEMSRFCCYCMEDMKVMMQLYSTLDQIQTQLNCLKTNCTAKLQKAVAVDLANTYHRESIITTNEQRKLIMKKIQENSDVVTPVDDKAEESAVVKVEPVPAPENTEAFLIHNSNVVSVTAYLKQGDEDSTSESSDDSSSDDDSSGDSSDSSNDTTDDSEESVDDNHPGHSRTTTIAESNGGGSSDLTTSAGAMGGTASLQDMKTRYNLREVSVSLERCSEQAEKTKRRRLLSRKKKKERYCCPVKDCDRQFRYKRARNDHVIGEHLRISRPFNCKTCSLRFVSAEKRDQHEEGHKLEGRPECRHCGKFCKSTRALARHSRNHARDNSSQGNYIKCENKGCNERFVDKASYLVHIKKEHLQMPQPYSCNKCPIKFMTEEDLLDHGNVHLNLTPYTCPICEDEKKFSTKKDLEKHTKLFHNFDHMNCIFCHKSLHDIETYKEHLLTHIHESKYVCEFCGQAHRREASLRKHLQESHPEAKLDYPTCTICEKTFKTLRSLNDHIRLHTRDFKYLCDKCSYGSMQKSHLVKHMETHSTKPNYECNICNKKFTTPDNLRSHKRCVHDATKNFPCDLCWKRFHNELQLQRHKAKAHNEKRTQSLPCSYCKKAFQYETTRQRHMQVAHPELVTLGMPPM